VSGPNALEDVRSIENEIEDVEKDLFMDEIDKLSSSDNNNS